MTLFGIFGRKQKEQPADTTPDISEDLFIEKNGNGVANGRTNGQHSPASQGIDAVHAFLKQDYESDGYGDAITNPDDTYKKENLEIIRHKLEIELKTAEKYYREALAQVDLFINVNSRSGLIDLVQQLETKRMVIEDQVKELAEIRDNLAENKGISQTPFLSYNKGFLRGLTAVTIARALENKI